MQKVNRLLYVLAIIKLIVPFFLQDSYYQPHRDEFLYLAEGHHMAWGYMEVPPLLSVFAWFTNLFGGGMFWIKIWPVLFGACTFILVGKIIISLGGKAFALILGWLPFMLDGYMRLFFLFQANFLEVFFWTAIVFSIFRFTQTQKNKWLYVFGVCVGLGMMSKYSVAFYTLSIVAGLAITRHRKIFLNRHLYYAACVAFIIFFPNLLWQYNHNFPVIAHMQELKEEQLQYINPLDFIISQFMMNFPCVFIWIAGLFFVMFSHKGKNYRVFAWAYIAVIILLIALNGKDYYALGAYPILFAFGGFYLEQLTMQKFKWVRYPMLAFSIGFGLFAMPLIMPLAKPETLSAYYQKTGLDKTGSFKWEDLEYHPLPQDFADMMGWKEMAQKTADVYHAMPKEEQEKTLVYCRGYFSAGALNYYAKEVGLPQVYSDDASFLFWMPETYPYKNLLLVAHRMPEKDDIVFQQFEKVTVKDTLNVPYFRESGMRYILFENANDSLNAIATKGVAELKKEFTR
ncbi:hypothetical protein BH10BAC2_BH10BAC2_49560 [soil metagenome]